MVQKRKNKLIKTRCLPSLCYHDFCEIRDIRKKKKEMMMMIMMRMIMMMMRRKRRIRVMGIV